MQPRSVAAALALLFAFCCRIAAAEPTYASWQQLARAVAAAVDSGWFAQISDGTGILPERWFSGLPAAPLPVAAPLLRGGPSLQASVDGGRRWSELPFACHAIAPTSVLAAAADAQRPGHVVALAGELDAAGLPIFACASGCPGVAAQLSGTPAAGDPIWRRACAIRPVAYNLDVAAELQRTAAAGFQMDRSGHPDANRLLENAAAGWGFASLAHLATDAPHQTCQLWDRAVGRPTFAGPYPLLPGAECRADPVAFCHADKPLGAAGDAGLARTAPAQRDHWCINWSSPDCNCRDLPAACKYPGGYAGLAIDPRNGFAYLATGVGLLTSRDGGAHWERVGRCDASLADPRCNGTDGAGRERDDAWPYADAIAPPANRAAKLLTWRGVRMQPRADRDLHALDLNVWPQGIVAVGPPRMAFAACADIAEYAAAGLGQAVYAPSPHEMAGPDGVPQRRVGRLTASLPVTWRGKDSAEVSSVFVAAADDCATALAQRSAGQPTTVAAPGPLVFRDAVSMPDGLVLGRLERRK